MTIATFDGTCSNTGREASHFAAAAHPTPRAPAAAAHVARFQDALWPEVLDMTHDPLPPQDPLPPLRAARARPLALFGTRSLASGRRWRLPF